jgi:biotin operon repressor
MEAGEIIRRWQQGQTKSQIAVSLGYDRKTVRKYIKALRELGIDRKDIITDSEKTYSLLETVVEQKKPRQEKWRSHTLGTRCFYSVPRGDKNTS